MRDTIPFRESNIKEYLDKCIRYWRNRRDMAKGDDLKMATHYIDAYQSVRVSIFGSLLSVDDEEKKN